ncbi:hypothetical protein SELMODRAFT_96868 [Selaginella moellendorffii]|uniref:Anaphase-promoting complex subunit 10 n=1 Tax=Selaginella moellendorffii TaxID=88036 RepID=D8RLU1_SELML|nr:hypothetical protein SELMODRAFT_96982 [Selaginella moellendorffii]EFJ26984.1 hypothetical protein SELMODRAFT_96868 [Selaginella moellendorffii]
MQQDEDEGERREIGKLAVWSVSSAKPGNGVDLLRDASLETYWQSDGAQPHLVNIQFQKKVRLQLLAIYVDFKLDESYTPNKISVRTGNSFYDLREIKMVELAEPVGWVKVSLCPTDSKEYLRAFLVQLAVLSNHQNGRDTHIRQIKIYGPRQNAVIGHPFCFNTIDFSMRSSVR